VLIDPLPFPQADRLVVLNKVSERRGIREAGVSCPAMQDNFLASYELFR
jgi:hypothetical protein